MIAVLISCFNRKNLTLDIVEKFAKHSEMFHLYVVDGGSTDGTLESLESLCKQFSNLFLIQRNDFYWAESMRLAWKSAHQKFYYESFLLLNDDLKIELNRLEEFIIESYLFDNDVIRVGLCMDSTKSIVTYGALVQKSKKSRIHFRIANENEEAVTFNANFLYVPRRVVEEIGVLSSKFRHSFADIDYGLRATKNKIAIKVISNPIGVTEHNAAWSNSLQHLYIRNFRKILFHPKGLPICEWLLFCRRHAGKWWIGYFFYRYLRMLVK